MGYDGRLVASDELSEFVVSYLIEAASIAAY
jgi:hypothetical protein